MNWQSNETLIQQALVFQLLINLNKSVYKRFHYASIFARVFKIES